MLTTGLARLIGPSILKVAIHERYPNVPPQLACAYVTWLTIIDPKALQSTPSTPAAATPSLGNLPKPSPVPTDPESKRILQLGYQAYRAGAYDRAMAWYRKSAELGNRTPMKKSG